ncbi:MAG TPA: sulfatase-like hydrolase/transferase, partial [Planctomycetota bacterium]|nr:sulfatase-like hydrolase/transferase [Planctomycetota bacterium]
MSRRLRAAVALLAVASAPACGERTPPPDVVLVLVDTLRADRTALLPGGPPTTPVLAALVAEGTSYTQAVAPSAWTLPSIASLFSGQDARAHALQGRPGLVTR